MRWTAALAMLWTLCTAVAVANVSRATRLGRSLIVRPASTESVAPGTTLSGYELVERTATLGVCNHVTHTKRLTDGAEKDEQEDAMKGVVVADQRQSSRTRSSTVGKAVVERAVDGVVTGTTMYGTCSAAANTDCEANAIAPDGPSLEYQCLLEDIDLIYVNANYRLKKKFAAGSHGEVWRATRPRVVDGQPSEQTFILKRLFVEKGELMVEMGLREAHFGSLLTKEPHVTRFVEYFFRGDTTKQTPPVVAPSLPASSSLMESGEAHELWLVFHDEGISLRHYLYASRDSAHTALLFETSPFWHKLRMDAHGEDVLREIMRQLIEGVAALHDRGITHRDIKPSNVLVHLQQQQQPHTEHLLTPPIVKLADFGSAVDEYTLRHLYGARGPTQAEETREYQPPEVLFSDYGAPYDYAHPLAYDLWSLGVVFLEIVLGSPQVFMISSRARARLDAKLMGKNADERTRLKSYLLHVLTHEFCIYQPPAHDLHRLWDQYALASDGCHFGRFNTTLVERDPMHMGLRNPWGLDLMWKLLQWNPSQRISARDALRHAFFHGPYMCEETGRQFATKDELLTHQKYLAAQRARDEEHARVVPEKYELPASFQCPHCHREFSTIVSCEQHVHVRRHGTTTHLCDHEVEPLDRAIREETTSRVTDDVPDHVGVAVLQGKKKYMEDFVVVDRLPRFNASVYAVIDGHLGTTAAEYVRTRLTSTLDRHLDTLELVGGDDMAFFERVVMWQVFLELHTGFVTSHDVHDFSGCTLTVVVHFESQRRLLSANVGDSRALFVGHGDQGQRIVPLSMDHWPNVDDERRRIESSGGFVSFEGLWRVVGQLAVSRSIGDRHLRQFVVAEPSVFSVDLSVLVDGPGSIVLGSDGVWDTVENQDMARLLLELQPRTHSLSHLARRVVQEAFVRGSLDNLAMVVVSV